MRSLPARFDRSNRRGHKPKLGQNFLVSPTAPRAIVDALGDLSHETVVEIGPGRGALTGLLAARAKQVIAVEIDPTLAAALQGDAIEVHRQDILSLDLTRLATERDVRLQIIGNLPYYISTPILMHLFAHSAVIDRAVLMAQREVAARIGSEPGSRDYGLLSATTQMYANVENLFTLPPEAFSPEPEVYSTVFRLTIRPRFEELRVQASSFKRFLQQIFAQKRKTLANNLRAAGYDPATVESAFAQCKVANTHIRAEAVALETMACLFRALNAEPM
ncbi:MAG TPA: 16S rRNA (adenine(1518)-N(6)/adenine(1519)-N(6))-dimethyltransferase RsmA [Acidobacteriaceae bacterium]|nr:16S rRNA (adenine(1518)-N(6)/adenine(1519)-N(6))-dimethyltransferase RsmA [Acidobacteriaceae bacterium]